MPTFRAGAACQSREEPIRLIERSHDSDQVFQEFWVEMFVSGKCKNFPNKLKFWFDEVVAQLLWSDGDLMYVVRGHDIKNLEIYTWVIAKKAHDKGIKISPAPVGLHI